MSRLKIFCFYKTFGLRNLTCFKAKQVSVMEQMKMGINSISSSSLFNNPQMIENSVSRPEGFQGSSKDVFVHDDNRDFANEQAFASAGRLFKSHASAQAQKAEGPITVQGDGVNMYRNRAGYDSSFLGKELPLPELGSSIKDKVAMRTDKPGEYVLPYTHFSIVMNGERKQCFYTISNIDGATHQDLPLRHQELPSPRLIDHGLRLPDIPELLRVLRMDLVVDLAREVREPERFLAAHDLDAVMPLRVRVEVRVLRRKAVFRQTKTEWRRHSVLLLPASVHHAWQPWPMAEISISGSMRMW